MSTLKTYPTLGAWETDPLKILDLILAKMTIANSDQSDMYKTVSLGAITSSVDTKSDLIAAIISALDPVLEPYYDSVNLQEVPISEHDSGISINVTLNGNTYTGKYAIEQETGKLRQLIDAYNSGE